MFLLIFILLLSIALAQFKIFSPDSDIEGPNLNFYTYDKGVVDIPPVS